MVSGAVHAAVEDRREEGGGRVGDSLRGRKGGDVGGSPLVPPGDVSIVEPGGRRPAVHWAGERPDNPRQIGAGEILGAVLVVGREFVAGAQDEGFRLLRERAGSVEQRVRADRQGRRVGDLVAVDLVLDADPAVLRDVDEHLGPHLALRGSGGCGAVAQVAPDLPGRACRAAADRPDPAGCDRVVGAQRVGRAADDDLQLVVMREHVPERGRRRLVPGAGCGAQGNLVPPAGGDRMRVRPGEDAAAQRAVGPGDAVVALLAGDGRAARGDSHDAARRDRTGREGLEDREGGPGRRRGVAEIASRPVGEQAGGRRGRLLGQLPAAPGGGRTDRRFLRRARREAGRHGQPGNAREEMTTAPGRRRARWLGHGGVFPSWGGASITERAVRIKAEPPASVHGGSSGPWRRSRR